MNKTIKQAVDEFMENSHDEKLSVADMNEIYETGETFNIITYAFYLGYMRGMKDEKGGKR